jgi:hypothetical protein
MEPMLGLEPRTSSLPRKCSTTELHGHGMNLVSSAWPANVKGAHQLLAWAAIEPKAPKEKDDPMDPQYPQGHLWALPVPGRGFPFSSPVFVLAERISADSRNSALELLRCPIIVPQPVTLTERALIKVCCKRFRVDDSNPAALNARLLESSSQLNDQRPSGIFNAVSRPVMIGRMPVHLPESECPTVKKLLIKLADGPDSAKAALTLLDAATTTLGRGRVGAALIAHTPAGVESLRVAFNLPDVSHLMHAEYLLLRSALAAGTIDFLHPATPPVTLISTRKPCRMCAAIILDVMGHNCQKVLYRHYDYGPMAARTVLNSNSFDRSLMPFIQGEREEQLDDTL